MASDNMKCKTCGKNFNTIATIAKHYRSAHPSKMRSKRPKASGIRRSSKNGKSATAQSIARTLITLIALMPSLAPTIMALIKQLEDGGLLPRGAGKRLKRIGSPRGSRRGKKK